LNVWNLPTDPSIVFMNTASTLTDIQWMTQALTLAKRGRFTARPNPMVGCVLVKDGRLVGQGFHACYGEAHAEVNALSEAGEQARGATAYVTLEPCAHTGKTGPCAKALIDAGVTRVVAAMRDPNPQVDGGGFNMLRAAGITVESGLLEAEACRLNRGFIKRMQQGMPWVTLKMAVSLDGRTAMADGKSQWITGAAARSDVQKLRAEQDAIITGAGTVLVDDPSLTVRAEDAGNWLASAKRLGFRQPARVILDRRGQLDLARRVFADNAQVYWQGAAKNMALPSHVKALEADTLRELLQQLASLPMNQVLVEAGSRVAAAFIEQNLVDELIIYMAPKLMGSTAMPLAALNIASMDACRHFQWQDMRRVGDDLKLLLTPAKQSEEQ